MIDAEYASLMARYNAWENNQIAGFVTELDEAALTQDRGAFFGSIFATLNHLLWGDRIWMSRFDDSVPPPGGSIAEAVAFTPTIGDWRAVRADMDGRIRDWVAGLRDPDLTGDLTWYSGATGKEQSRPMWLCVTHFFNHQTHHRGQVHAMLTSTGSKAPVSDLVFMPEDA